MTPRERRLRELEEKMKRLEQLHAAMGNVPIATICHTLMEVCEILAEELGERETS